LNSELAPLQRGKNCLYTVPFRISEEVIFY
jgi:hypothetical protein